jgi:uncharacterized protein (TIGR03067 family)
MKPRVLFVLSVGLLVGAQAQDDAKKEMANFKGTWSLLSVVLPTGDKGPSENDIKEMKLVFGQPADDSMVMKFGDKGEKASTYKLDPSKSPKEIDMQPSGGPKLAKGIYKLDGDTLVICANNQGDRPKEFKADKASGTSVLTLKRDKK